SNLAAQSEYRNELNSFCTVFAKTEIMNWMFDGVGMMDIARGIYLSIANRVSKLRIDPDLPLFMIGGVISHHPFLKNILEDKFGREILVVEKPQYTVSVGAALLAGQAFSEQP
ncbi:MAG: BadF/BadG/BcrA/BcrD ATPase family protein, partial [Flavobacteriales bacterium]